MTQVIVPSKAGIDLYFKKGKRLPFEMNDSRIVVKQKMRFIFFPAAELLPCCPCAGM